MENSDDILVLPLYGGAEKSSFDMNVTEFEKAAASIRQRAREKAFSKGLPIYYSKGINIIAEFPDGHTMIIEGE